MLNPGYSMRDVRKAASGIRHNHPGSPATLLKYMFVFFAFDHVYAQEWTTLWWISSCPRLTVWTSSTTFSSSGWPTGAWYLCPTAVEKAAARGADAVAVIFSGGGRKHYFKAVVLRLKGVLLIRNRSVLRQAKLPITKKEKVTQFHVMKSWLRCSKKNLMVNFSDICSSKRCPESGSGFTTKPGFNLTPPYAVVWSFSLTVKVYAGGGGGGG